jgi:Arm DNA-binding domain/Phage integrase, N-terminal SAM-like domain
VRGHIVKPSAKRSNLWAVVIELPRDPITGKRKQKWHSGFRTRKEAERKLAEILTRLDQGTYVEQSRMTLSAFLDEWLPAVRSTVRPSTCATYETVVNCYLKKNIVSLPLQAITPLTLRTLYADLLATGRKNGKDGLSPATVRYVHAVLRKALKDAVRSNLVTRNVVELVDPPRVQRAQIKTWSAREVRMFLEHVRDDRLYAAYVLAATTGMRERGGAWPPLAGR